MNDSQGSTCLWSQQLQRPDTLEASVPATGEGTTGLHMCLRCWQMKETRLHAYSVWGHTTDMCVITRKHQAWLQWEGLMFESWVLTGCKLRASCRRDWSVWERSCWKDCNIRGSATAKVIGLIQLVDRSVHMAMNEATGRPGGTSYQVQWISTASSWINPLCVHACMCMHAYACKENLSISNWSGVAEPRQSHAQLPKI